MKVLLVADGRSPITLRWAQSVLALGHSLALVSTYPCDPLPGAEVTFPLPVAFARLAGAQSRSGAAHQRSFLRSLVGRFRGLFLAGRYRFGPLTLPSQAPYFRRFLSAWQPDLVHALRLPFEGMLASFTPPDIPLAVSIWGNDLTLHASGSRLMRSWTRRTLQRADGLAADAWRDLRLGEAWGFVEGRPVLMVPGNGGLDLEMMMRLDGFSLPPELASLLPAHAPCFLNPRGLRPGSVRTDTFFAAIPAVLEKLPEAHFVCPAMQGQSEAESAVAALQVSANVHLLPALRQEGLWALMKRSSLSLSISQHDGTPNSLLEAMALGCFPIAGDIDSTRQWITPGVNGLLVDAADPQELSAAILAAWENPALRAAAAAENLRRIQSDASIEAVRPRIQAFYEEIVSGMKA